MTRFQQIRFQHCFRQANRCADNLARMSVSQELDFILYDSPHLGIVRASLTTLGALGENFKWDLFYI